MTLIPGQSIAVGVGLLAAFYQWYLKDLLFTTIGIGRVMQPIEDFPYSCRRIQHPRLEACEDMWLDDEARVLYAACGGALSRPQWCPSLSRLNISGRRLGGDYVSVLQIDEPGSDGLFGLKHLMPVNYEGATADGTLDLHGFDVEVMSNSTLKFWMINHRPPVDENRNYLDAVSMGANSTIEVFEVIRGSDADEMVHVETIANEAIFTPNKLAATGDGGFIATNDKSAKGSRSGKSFNTLPISYPYSVHQYRDLADAVNTPDAFGHLRRELDYYIGGGSLSYCSPTECHIAATDGFTYPNGMTKGKDGLYYIPSSFLDKIRVMELQPDLMLREVDVIHLGMPVDNLSTDKNGDIYAAAFPKVLTFLSSFKDPYHVDSPSTIWRIRKSGTGSGYEVKKVLEDREARIMGGATVARHDVKTGRLFIGGAAAPYITVCDPR